MTELSKEQMWTLLRVMFGKELKAATLVILRQADGGKVLMDTYCFPSSDVVKDAHD